MTNLANLYRFRAELTQRLAGASTLAREIDAHFRLDARRLPSASVLLVDGPQALLDEVNCAIADSEEQLADANEAAALHPDYD